MDNIESKNFCIIWIYFLYTTSSALKKIAQDTPDFETFKDNLIDTLIIREPDAHRIDTINPFVYVDSPLNEINICDITNSDNLVERADMQARNIERGVPGGHGIALGRQIQIPLAVKITNSGTYDIVDGFHRSLQAIMNGGKTILAFIVGEKDGLTLKEFYDQARIELK